jgi:hypothetical protein
MVGQKPPLPRTYPVFRFATVLATLLLFFTFATNFMAPRLAQTTVSAPYGIGGGGGGEAEEPELAMEVPAAEPSAPEEPAEAAKPAEAEPAMEEAEALEEPAVPEPAPTVEDSARAVPTPQPAEKSGVQEAPPGETFAQQVSPEVVGDPFGPRPPVSLAAQIILVIIALLSGLVTLILRYSAIRKWRAKAK